MNIFIASIVLWLFFIVTTSVQKFRVKGNHPIIQAIANFISFFFVIFDVIFNVTYGSIAFLQWPHYKRLTLTARLKYILTEPVHGWRWALALFVCTKMIEPWDYNHCGLFDE